MAKENDIGRILIYQNEKGDTKIDVYFEKDTIWMSQRNIAELYQTTPQNITLHIKNIYSDGELEENSTCKNYLQVQKEGNNNMGLAQRAGPILYRRIFIIISIFIVI